MYSPNRRYYYNYNRGSRYLWSSVYLILLLAGALLWLGGHGSSAAAQTDLHNQEAQARIEAAWANAETLSQYDFRSRLLQKTYPAPSVATAGRPPQEDRLALEGSFFQTDQRMETMIWSNHTFDPDIASELRVENGRSYVRYPNETTWEEVDNLSDSMTPGGDPFSFLAGMSSVQDAGQETRTINGIALTYETYTFKLNSGAFASYVERLAAQMAVERGDLPQGMAPGINERLRGMTGTGRVWLDEQGNLARISMDITFPEEESGEVITAELTTDFYNFVTPDTAATPSWLTAPLARLQVPVEAAARPEMAETVGWVLLGIVLFVLLTLFVWHQAHTKAFHTTLASLIIVSMILPPLIQAKEAHAYFEQEIVRSQEQAAQEKEQELQEVIHQSAYQSDWNPKESQYDTHHELLLAHDISVGSEAEATAGLLQLTTDSDEFVDSDGDRVSDDDEIYWDSCPYPIASAEYNAEPDCINVTDVSDSDGDGLTDYAEVYQLGTMPGMADSDGDTITDTLEVAGFFYNGEQWYLNPLEEDTNRDGVHDGLECFAWSSLNDDVDPTAVCPDTDNDGVPDLFDIDDDGDSVLDMDDRSPNTFSGPFNNEDPLKVTIDGLEIDQPVTVELQIRPTDPDLISYNGHVLDWPEGDYEGQITRGLSTTLATTSNSDAFSTDTAAAFGEMRVTPMLQVTMPYEDGHYANMPVNDAYAGIDRTLGITTGQWLDESELAAYAVSVLDADTTSGELNAYLPLSTVYSDAGGTPVSFAATMFYSPTQGSAGIADWGAAHEYRLVWMVQMLTDTCINSGPVLDSSGIVPVFVHDTEETCTREESFDVVHMFTDDPWTLAAINIEEHHGLDVAHLYEDPTEDVSLNSDDQLWAYAWNLSSTFVEGLDCDSTTANGDGTVSCNGDGNRDVTLADIPAKLTEWGTESGTDYNYTVFDGIESYPHTGYWGYVGMTSTTGILDSIFLPHVQSQDYTSLMIAYEVESRSIGLDSAAGVGSGELTFDLSDTDRFLQAGLTLKTFEYDSNEAKWGEADMATYLDYLVNYLGNADDYFMVEDDSQDAADELEGKLLWIQAYYSTLTAGMAAMVTINGEPISVNSFESTDAYDDFLLYSTLASNLYAGEAARKIGLLTSKMIQDKILGRNAVASAWKFMKLIYSADDLSSTPVHGRNGKYIYTYQTRSYKQARVFHNKKLNAFAKTGLATGHPKIIKGSMKLFLFGALVFVTGFVLQELVGENPLTTQLIVGGLILVAVSSIVMTGVEMIALFAKVKIAKFGLNGNFGGLDARTSRQVMRRTSGAYRSMAVYGFVVGVILAGLMFAFTLIVMGDAARNFHINTALATLVASIIVELVLFVIGLIVPVGTFLVLLIGLIDAILVLLSTISDAFDLGWGIPSAVTEAITRAIASSIYEFDIVPSNVDHDDRLIMTFDFAVLDPAVGFAVANSMQVSATVTNTIWTTDSDHKTSDLKDTRFLQALTEDESIFEGLTAKDNTSSDDWISLSYDEYAAVFPDSQLVALAEEGGFPGSTIPGRFTGVWQTHILTATIPLAQIGTGVNKDIDTLLFVEKYRIVGEGCWKAGNTRYNCEDTAFKGEVVMEIDPIPFDVFPNTASELIDLTWSSINSLHLLDQYDQDGDGLINQKFNGSDPDDTKLDTDGDGLYDYYEVTNGLDATGADSDGDGLTDFEELEQYFTDPSSSDSDSDGLNDYIEAKQGWLVSYEDQNGDLQTTRVWSDPLIDDLDDDGLGDLQEYLYGLHPSNPYDVSSIDTLIEFDEFALDEGDAPVLFLQMEEAAGQTFATDFSGQRHNFSCVNCPEMDVDGYYGQAFEFDGNNDQLTATLDIELAEFTTAAWIYPDAGGNAGWNTIMGGGDATPAAERAPTMFLVHEDRVQVSVGDGSNNYAIDASSVVTPDSWNHVASTFDGTALTLYVNGTAVGTNTSAAGIDPADISDYYIGYRGTNRRFDGKIDELIVYDHALTEAEIGEMMDGRYNLNDLIVLPDTELTYQATITNNATTRDANGFIYTDTTIDTPEIPTPLFASGFEVEQRQAHFRSEIELKNWATSNTALAYCEDDGTCPTISSDGVYGNAVDFDGVDDALVIPQFTDGGTDYQDGPHIFFWMYIDSLPTSGRVKILDTDSTDPAALDIELDSNGRIHFDSDSYEDVRGTIPLEAGYWYQIGFLGGEIYIQGGINSINSYGDETSDSSTHYQPIIGPGRLGNAVGGGEAFDGRIDDLVLYYGDDMLDIEAASFLSDLNDGDYSSNVVSPDEIFTFEGLFSDVDNLTGVTSTSELFYAPSTTRQFVDTVADNGGVLTCTDGGTCPTAGVSGPYGNAIEFDGNDDFLIVPKLSSEEVVEQASDETHIFFWLNINSYPASGSTAMILDSDSIEDGAIDIYLDSSGYLHFDSLAYEDGVSASPIGTGSWVHIGYRRGDELFIDGVSQGDITPTTADYNYPVYGPGRLGNSMAGDAPFDGQIDELTIFHEGNVTSSLISGYIYQGDYFRSASGLRADAVFAFESLIHDDTSSDVGYLNLATGLREADCVDSTIGCPTVTAGVYGDGLIFDGANDALELTPLDFAQSDYTIGVWFKSTDSNNQGFLSATDENGLAVYAHLNTGGLPRILHRFPGGTSGGTAVSTSDTYNDGAWHYFTAVKDGTTLTLYVDGVWQGEAAGVTTAATGSLETAVGYRSVGSLYHLNGSLDELVILDEAVDHAGVQYLMNSQYPAIEIENRFTTFDLSPLTTQTVSGTAQVAAHVASGATLGFVEEVEAAFELDVDLTGTTFDHGHQDDASDGTDISGYFRFEEIPGASLFNNQVAYTENVLGDTLEVDGVCGYTNCPLSGVRGVDGRALYFDGLDDFLWLDMTVLDSYYIPQAQSVSVWVKGTEGTIFNRGLSANDDQLQLDHGRISYISSFDDYISADFEMPVDQWTHVAVSIADDGRIRTWVDGKLVVDLHTYDESTADDVGNWVIGANYGTQNHYQGYIDELYIYENELTEAEMLELYTETAPVVRFEFDEARDEINFVDAVNGYVAEPAATECVDLYLETLTVQQLDDTLSNVTIDVAGETAAYLSVDDFGAVVTDTTAVSLTLNAVAPICDTRTISVNGVYSDGTEVLFSGTASPMVAEAGLADLVATSGSQQVVLSYRTGAIYELNTPVAGTDGRIGNTLYFPSYGDGYLDILNSDGLGDFATDDFTIMTWVKTDAIDNPIFTKSNADGQNDDGEKILVINGAGELEMINRGGSNTKIESTEVITDNVWHHVVVTWDYDGSGTGGTGAIYVDGVDVTDPNGDYDAGHADNSGDGWQIGRRDRNGGVPSFFDGQLDEFAIYTGRALSGTLVYETYLQQARWYRDRAEFTVIIDDDVPTMTVQTSYQYLAEGYTQLVITPDDPTSGVALVQFGVKGPDDTEFVWDTAERCSGSAVVYCPTFWTATEGTYEVMFRLVDAVGHETIVQIDDYYLDLTSVNVGGTAAVTADPVRVASASNLDSRMTAASVALSVVISQTGDRSWVATFGGTVIDPDVTPGVAGSGVDEDQFYVTVFNSAGTAVGSFNQPATVNKDTGTWSIDYVMTGTDPAGTYTVKVIAQDEKGNETETTIGTFTADEQAPAVKVARALLPSLIISDTHVISGVVSDQPYWARPELMFHFEESAGAAEFYNYGAMPQLIPCVGVCPQTTEFGPFGRGLDFDGTGTAGWGFDAEVISDTVNFDAADEFAIAFWMLADNPQADLTQTSNVLVEKWGDGVRYPFSIHYHNQSGSHQGLLTATRSDGVFTTVVSSTTTLSDSAYHHVALVQDSGELTLYIDGAPEMTVTDIVSDTTKNDGDFAIGYRPDSGGYHFSGVIDELMVYNTRLSAMQVYALAQDGIRGMNQVEVAFEPINFASYPDFLSINERKNEVTWQAATLDQPNGLGSAWSYTMSDMEQLMYIHVRGQDGSGNQDEARTVWHGLIDHVPPTISAAGQQVGYGDLRETVYTFTLSDYLLDAESAVYPCGDPDLTMRLYDDSTFAYDGLPYEISGTCTVSGWENSGTIEVCDGAGHCVQEIVTPAGSTDLGAIQILTPTASLTGTAAGIPLEVTGAAVAANGLQTVTITVNGAAVETIGYQSSVTETMWSTTDWTPVVTGTYTVTARLTDALGAVYTDTLTLDLVELTATDSLTLTDVSVDGADLLFAWAAAGFSGCDIYVYHSTAPYAGFTQGEQLLTSPQAVTPLTGAAAFYQLQAPSCGDGTAVSETMGVFTFDLSVGD